MKYKIIMSNYHNLSITTLPFQKALSECHKKNKIIFCIDCIFVLAYSFSYLLSEIKNCKNEKLNSFIEVTFMVGVLTIAFHLKQLLILRNKPFLIRMATRFNEIQQDSPMIQESTQMSDPNANPGQQDREHYDIEHRIRGYIFKTNYILGILLCVIVILMQFQIILFTIILYNKSFKNSYHPFVHFSGNCQDLLLNLSLLIYFVEVMACFLFYFSCCLMVTTFPVLLFVLLVALIRHYIKKRQNRRKFRNFKVVRWLDEESEVNVCSICLQQYKREEQVKVLPCDHQFHTTCVDEWLRSHTLCPLCRCDCQ